MTAEIEITTYKEERTEYFLNQIDHYNRKCKWWMKAAREGLQSATPERVEKECTDAGLRMQFYGDAIRALQFEADYKQLQAMKESIEEQERMEAQLIKEEMDFIHNTCKRCRHWDGIFCGVFHSDNNGGCRNFTVRNKEG